MLNRILKSLLIVGLMTGTVSVASDPFHRQMESESGQKQTH